MTRFSTDKMKVKLAVFFFLNDFCVEIRMFFIIKRRIGFEKLPLPMVSCRGDERGTTFFRHDTLSLKFVFKAYRVIRAFENTVLLTNLDNTIFIVLVPLRAVCAKSQRV